MSPRHAEVWGGQFDPSSGDAVPSGVLLHKNAENGCNPLPDWWTDTDSAGLGRPPVGQWPAGSKSGGDGSRPYEWYAGLQPRL